MDKSAENKENFPATMLVNTKKPKLKKKLHFKNITNLHNLKILEVFKYILELQKSLRKARQNLKKYKEKFRTAIKNRQHSGIIVNNVDDKSIQVNLLLKDDDSVYENIVEVTKSLKKDPKSRSSSPTEQQDQQAIETLNFVKEIKEAAENAQTMAGFVYEPTSGLYYDCKTGYYYNAEFGLYYDGNSGCYYKYNQIENKFEFHSQPERQEDELPTNDSPTRAVEEKDVVEFTMKKYKSKYKEKKYIQTTAEHFDQYSSMDRHRRRNHHQNRRHRRRGHGDRRRSRSSHRRNGKHQSIDRSASPPPLPKQRSRQRRNHHDRDSKKTNQYYRRSISSRSSSSSSSSSSVAKKRQPKSETPSSSTSSSPSLDKNKKTKSCKRHATKKERHNSRSRSSSSKKRGRCNSDEDSDTKEDGQISSDDDEESSSSSQSKDSSVIFIDETSVGVPHYEDIAKTYPPALRIVVLATNVPKLSVGSLFLITYKGGSLGREGAHDVIIPDINISKYHLNFTYNESKSYYECIDLGSRNGTILNGKRMSNSQQESEAKPILHGSQMQLSQTKLLFHIHDGHTTCAQCEPGLLVPQTSFLNGNLLDSTASIDGQSTSAPLTHKQELKKLKKRYGLADEKYVERTNVGNNMIDRAAQRRKEIGSSNQHEKTQVASVDLNIPTDNKGFKMLAKLGWSEGQKLGKNDQGLLEPIAVVSNVGKKGLGCDDVVSNVVTQKMIKKTEQMRITKERFNQNQQEQKQEQFPDIFISESD